MKLQALFTSVALLVALIMSGCSSRSVQAKNSGFFQDYESIKTNNSIDYVDTKGDMSKYKSIIVAPVLVISAIKENEQSASLKKLYKDISEYLTSEYKKLINSSGKYTLVESDTPNALRLESAVSAVEVHFDDKKWDQFTPVSLGLSVVSFNAYMDEDVRLLGEKRLIDTDTSEVISRSMHIIKDEKIIVNGDNLEFKDIQAALDGWLEQLKQDLQISK